MYTITGLEKLPELPKANESEADNDQKTLLSTTELVSVVSPVTEALAEQESFLALLDDYR